MHAKVPEVRGVTSFSRVDHSWDLGGRCAAGQGFSPGLVQGHSQPCTAVTSADYIYHVRQSNFGPTCREDRSPTPVPSLHCTIPPAEWNMQGWHYRKASVINAFLQKAFPLLWFACTVASLFPLTSFVSLLIFLSVSLM